MKIYVEDKDKYIELETENLNELGSGFEGIVYSYNDIAIKIKKNFTTASIGYEDAIKLKNIFTSRILLPEGIIYSDLLKCKKNFIGYTTKLIKNNLKRDIIYIDPKSLYNEIQFLIGDVNELSNNKIFISDLGDNSDNFVFDGHLYFVDPGCFSFSKTYNANELKDENNFEVSNALLLNIIVYGGDLNKIKEELIEKMHLENKFLSEIILMRIRDIYCDSHFEKLRDNTNITQLEYFLKTLEKYGSLDNYKYSLLTEYVSDKSNNSNNDLILRKIIK